MPEHLSNDLRMLAVDDPCSEFPSHPPSPRQATRVFWVPLGVREARRASEINVSDPPKLDEEILARIRSIHRDYFERWTLLPVGGTLDLRF